MQYIHVRNLETYHPGYKDRNLSWCKTYFTMINADPDFEMCDEIDKWRFICLVMLELQLKKPVPVDPAYLTRKGFNLKKRPISLTIQMLHNFLVTVTEDSNLCTLDKEEDKEKDIEKKSVTQHKALCTDIIADLNEICKTAFKPENSNTQKLIISRLKEGFDLKAFRAVHRKKFADWGGDEKMRKYLRPQTLYGTKFEAYLNEPDKTAPRERLLCEQHSA